MNIKKNKTLFSLLFLKEANNIKLNSPDEVKKNY